MIGGKRLRKDAWASRLTRQRLRAVANPVAEVGDAFYGTFTVSVLYRSGVYQVLTPEQRDQLRAWSDFLDRPQIHDGGFVFFHLANRTSVTPAVKVPLEGEQRHKSTVPVLEPDVRKLTSLFPGMVRMPSVAIRVPPVWAALLAAGC